MCFLQLKVDDSIGCHIFIFSLLFKGLTLIHCCESMFRKLYWFNGVCTRFADLVSMMCAHADSSVVPGMGPGKKRKESCSMHSTTSGGSHVCSSARRRRNGCLSRTGSWIQHTI